MIHEGKKNIFTFFFNLSYGDLSRTVMNLKHYKKKKHLKFSQVITRTDESKRMKYLSAKNKPVLK
jgi:hypothetical protein